MLFSEQNGRHMSVIEPMAAGNSLLQGTGLSFLTFGSAFISLGANLMSSLGSIAPNSLGSSIIFPRFYHQVNSTTR